MSMLGFPASGEKKYYLANLPAKADLRTLAATIKARWICEQAQQQLKEELGLDHTLRADPGRACIAHDNDRLRLPSVSPAQNSETGKKRIDGPPPQPTLPAVRQAILELIAQPPKQRCPYCQKWICNKQRRE
jgi:hypothetical protein